MQIECLPACGAADVRCDLCGRGFLLLAPEASASLHLWQVVLVEHALRQQHDGSALPGGAAHPQQRFSIDTLSGLTPEAVRDIAPEVVC